MHMHVSEDVAMLYNACAACGCTAACMESESMEISCERGNKTVENLCNYINNF